MARNEELGLHGGGDDLLCVVGGVGESDERGLRGQKDEAGEGDEEEGVAEVGDTGGDAGAGGVDGGGATMTMASPVGCSGLERGRGVGEGLSVCAGTAGDRPGSGRCEGRAHAWLEIWLLSFLVFFVAGVELFLAAAFLGFGGFFRFGQFRRTPVGDAGFLFGSDEF